MSSLLFSDEKYTDANYSFRQRNRHRILVPNFGRRGQKRRLAWALVLPHAFALPSLRYMLTASNE